MKRSLTTRNLLPIHLAQIFIVTLLSLGSLSIGGSFFIKQAFKSSNQTEIITNTSRYREIRHQLWQSKNQIQHFPEQIPDDAKEISLAYSSGQMQGSSFLQLRLKLPPEKIKKLLTQYSTAKYKYIGGDTNEHSNLLNGVPTTFFYTSNSGEDSFPSSYEILVLDANDRGNSGFPWNHGDSYGVAIDSSASEIIYWVEEW
jgi:hypothetical protein